MARQFKPGQLQTGSLFNISSSYALTASFALNGGGGTSFPYTGAAIISGSLAVTGSVKATAGFTGSLQGTATFAAAANTAFYADTANSAALAAAPSGDWIPAKPNPEGISPYNLGSPDAAWNSIYVNHGTIYFLSESVGNPTTSGSLSIVDDPIEGSRFVLGTRDAVGQKKEIIISDKGASLAISASIAQTASYISPTFISQSAAASGFGSGTSGTGFFIATGSITASVGLTGDIFIIRSSSYNPFTVSSTGMATISGSAANLFLIKNAINQPVLTVSQSGVLTLATSSVVLTGTAPNGAIYFTSNSLYVGLD
jgi:hypothetical protein